MFLLETHHRAIVTFPIRIPQTSRIKYRVASRVSDTCCCSNTMNLRFRIHVQNKCRIIVPSHVRYDVYIDVSPSETIGHIKARLQSERNLKPPAFQTMRIHDEILEDRFTLSDYAIQFGEPLSRMWVWIWMDNAAFDEPIRWSMRLKFRVITRSFGDFAFGMDVSPSDTIRQIKEKLHIENIESVSYDGQNLDDTLTLSDYGLQLPEPLLSETLLVRIHTHPRSKKPRRQNPWWGRGVNHTM